MFDMWDSGTVERMTEIPPGYVVGLDGRLHPSHPLTEPERSERTKAILKLRGQGKSVRAIAAELGLSVGTVHRTIQQQEN
jgi:DNA-binding NarL/FixJ family response regulator